MFTWEFVINRTITLKYLSHRKGAIEILFSSSLQRDADVAQLVAHNLAKVRVAGSSPVIRSGFSRS